MISPAAKKPVLDKYELFEEIGHGGMATVYRAVDKRLGREVALKVIHRHLRENPEVAARFAREARAVAKLRHPGIVEVYDVSAEEEDERYLVVELVRGTTLRAMLRELDYLPAEVAAALGLELAAALQHAHEQGVVHRDLKPENVLVEVPGADIESSQPRLGEDQGLRIMLTDFGIAKLLDAQGVTSTGQVLGSPAHMAPEQIEGGDVTARSDVFALGVLMYECMVGHLPFEGKNPAQVLRRVLDGIYPAAVRERSTIGTRWSNLLDRALAGAQEERFESAADLNDAIRGELDALGFDDPRAELVAYLENPTEYLEGYEPRLVDQLVARGERARVDRDIPLATAQFNRALAFRPGDRELLAQVSRVARGERFRRTAQRTAVVATLALVGAGGAFAVTRAAREESEPPPLSTTSAEVPEARPVASAAPTRAPAISAEPPGEPAPREADSKRMRIPKWPIRPKPAPPTDQGERAVIVQINGLGRAVLRINGEPRAWYGRRHMLSVGKTYEFEFAPPPGESCCVASKASVKILPGEGAQRVVGRVKFKDATLRVGSGPAGGQVFCPELTGARALLPGSSLNIPMDRLKTLPKSCTLSSPNSPSKQKQVTLRAGQTVVLSWQ